MIGEHPKSIEKVLAEFGVYLKASSYSQDVKPLLKEVCSKVFGNATGIVDMLVKHVPSSKQVRPAVQHHHSKALHAWWMLQALRWHCTV